MKRSVVDNGEGFENAYVECIQLIQQNQTHFAL